MKESENIVERTTFAALRSQNQRLAFLYDISLTAGRSLDLKEILDESLSRIISFMGADSGVVYVINDETQELVPVSFENLGDEAVEDLCENKVKVGECMCGKIAECDEEVIISENASADPRFTREVIRREGMEFYAGLPLKAKGKVIGVICVITHSPYTPEPELLDILRAATVPLALAIENATIFQSEMNRARQKVEHHDFDGIISTSNNMKAVLDLVRKVKDLPTSLLIYGESGTGKELIARAAHFNSIRKDKPFVTINCAAIPEALLESEFFGHEKGAFTNAFCDKKGLFESADGGTIFLDEINTMSTGLQAKLLRVLQDGSFMRVGSTKTLSVDVRIIAATNQILKDSVEAGTFREDLFYRLNVLNIDIPPLRDRKEDIPLLAHSFLHRFSIKLDRKVKRFSSGSLELLMSHDWPGNVRELENTIERAVVITDNSEIGEDDLPENISQARRTPAKLSSLKSIELEHIQKVLKLTQNNKKEAAKILGINSSTLWRKLNP
jgi:transcriptional regulator with PAS, ATPase and Fis domain